MIPFVETLKWSLVHPERVIQGLKLLKEEMLKSLTHGLNMFTIMIIIATFHHPQFEVTFFEQAKTDSITQALLTICEYV